MTSADPPQELVGRSTQLELIRSLLAFSGPPHVLMLRGEPGVGKSALLDAAASLAQAAGMPVLRATGAESEVDVSFAGLSQALLLLQERMGQLGPAHRRTLSAALGLGEGSAQSLDAVAEAVAALLREEARTRPLVLIVDDLQWIDHATTNVLIRLIPGVAGRSVRLLLASRAGPGSLLEAPGAMVHDVPPLAGPGASDLMRAHFPDLAESVVLRLLAEAAGNPLALLELPSGLRMEQRSSRVPLPEHLPLTRRLHRLYAGRIERLAPDVRRLLLLAALHGALDLRCLIPLGAAGTTSLLLAAAEHAGLLAVGSPPGWVGFRHPLVRASVVESSTSDERRQAHRDLAQMLPGDPERRMWHLAEASVQPDAAVSLLLEQAARRILSRGDAVGAVSAMLRSADLSPQRDERARRLTLAAYVGADAAGNLQQVPSLLATAQQIDPHAEESIQSAITASYLLLNGDGDVATAFRLLAGAIENEAERSGPGSPVLAEALHNLLKICLYGSRPELWWTFREAIKGFPLGRHPTLALWVATTADPARTASAALGVVDEVVAGLQEETDLGRIERVATALSYVDRVDDVRAPLLRAVHDARRGGAVTAGINALVLLSVDDFKTGRWQEGQRFADEGVGLCEQHGYRLLTCPLHLARGLIAAACGDDATAYAVADDITTWAIPRGVLGLQNYVGHIRSLAALSRGDYQEAFEQAASVNPAGSFTPHAGYALWTCMDLVEAAVRGNRRGDAVAHVRAMHEAGISALSSRLALLVAGSAAMAAAVDFPELFERALRLPQVDRWPFDLARVRLFYGERLRRSRHSAAAREQLERAEAIFLRLGATPWAERARTELLATSATKSPAGSRSAAGLTPQEHAVAGLAAVGFTNRQIAERLQISHRTVGAHLRQVFRKLGVPTRAALHDGLDRVGGRFVQRARP